MFKTITYQGNEFIVTHEITPEHIWAYRDLGNGLIDIYRNVKGAIVTETVVVSILQQIFSLRDYYLEIQMQEGQCQLNYEQHTSMDGGDGTA